MSKAHLFIKGYSLKNRYKEVHDSVKGKIKIIAMVTLKIKRATSIS